MAVLREQSSFSYFPLFLKGKIKKTPPNLLNLLNLLFNNLFTSQAITWIDTRRSKSLRANRQPGHHHYQDSCQDKKTKYSDQFYRQNVPTNFWS